jgi:Protein of unknown function (DUF3047)
MQFAKACSALFVALPISVCFSAETPSAFSDPSGKIDVRWEPFSFAKVNIKTQYEIVRDTSHGTVLHARAEGGASALRYKIEKMVDAPTLLKWSWKLGELPAGSSAKQKETDDFAARLYVTFAYDPAKASTLTRAEMGLAKSIYGDYPPMSALSYIVEPNLPVGTIVDNPFTSRVKMVVVENGKQLGQWKSFERDIFDDYKRAFGTPPATALSGVVVMTDADNTHSRAEAWFGDISLQAKP